MYYQKLEKKDLEINKLRSYYNQEPIAKFLSISDNFFDYVVSTSNIYYYKVKIDDEIIGGLHFEITDEILYLSLWINPIFHRQGYAIQILNDMKNNVFNLNYKKINVGISINNIASINLFEKVGYKKLYIEDNIINYELEMS